MPKWTDALKNAVATVAPGLGAALGGPLGGTAGTMIAKALGKENESGDAIEAAVLTADPEALMKLRAAELDFQKFLKEADLKIESLANEDRASARSREIEIHDRTPALLGWAVTIGFFGVLLWMLKFGLPTHGEQALLVMLGALGGSQASVINYFYGSSSSSRTKDATISAALQK